MNTGFLKSTGLLLMLLAVIPSQGADLQNIAVHPSGRYLMHEDGSAFFLLADTQWELTHSATREEAEKMLDNRQSKGFNAINLALMFHWVNMEPNAYGHIGGTPEKWNEKYWEHVDFIVDAIIERGMHPVLFPAWGNLMGGENNLFDPTTAEAFGRWVAKRYQNRKGIMYVLGGDRIPNEPIIDAVGRGLKAVSPDRLVSFHPHNSKSSSWYFHKSDWLDLHMIQTGHQTRDQLESFQKVTGLISSDYSLKPVRPVIDIEPRYEEYYPNDTSPPFDDYDTRLTAYWGVFSGGAGTGYAYNQVWAWGRYSTGPERVWNEIDSTASFQMQHLKNLMLSRPYFSRIPDQSLIANPGNGIVATRGDGYAMIYLHEGQTVTVKLGRIAGEKLKTWWYNPRTGIASFNANYNNAGTLHFNPPGPSGRGNDWVLVVDDANQNFPEPGKPVTTSAETD